MGDLLIAFVAALLAFLLLVAAHYETVRYETCLYYGHTAQECE